MLSINEIRDRAYTFAKDHENDSYEKGESQTFWNDFFNVFGVDRKRVAAFEQHVEKLGNKGGFIDCFWPSKLLVEHKSQGESLEAASVQAFDYFHGLKDSELPEYVLVSDFKRFRIYELAKGSDFYEFKLSELPKNIELFAFITGREKVETIQEDPVNIKASKLMGKLHDTLQEVGYTGHDLEVFLVRILFCLFAEDTGIFSKHQFEKYIKQRTAEDGSDLGAKLSELFQILDDGNRLTNLDEELSAFPYVNGHLFSERLRITAFTAKMREQLLNCTHFDWSRISPAIFGSLFQYVMDPERRRNIGAHYTDEKNILKLIKPLFLDELWEEFEAAKRSSKKLQELHDKLAEMNILDPACGCGNFLVITYRELRKLELEILKLLNKKDHEIERRSLLSIKDMIKIDVDQFYGIEIEEFPAKIAEVSLWLMDHQMNNAVAAEFGHDFQRIPLKKTATIRHANSLRIDWEEILNSKKCNFIIGNPPYYGSKLLDDNQKEDMAIVCGEIDGFGVLDYVSAWFKKSADYIQGTNIRVGLVSTNSITQGEQVGILWKYLLEKRGVKIIFAHQTFKWDNQASDKAQVFVVIIGFSLEDINQGILFEYSDIRGEPVAKKVKNINPYLVDGPNLLLAKRSKPLCSVPEIGIGNKPIDGGYYLFSTEEKEEFLKLEPKAEGIFRKWLGSQEFINGEERWCLWLGNMDPSELRSMPEVMKRIEAVKNFRLGRKSIPTIKLAETPTRFHVENMPNNNYLIIPKVSSERRSYIPIGFVGPEIICSDLVMIFPNASIFHFGVLSSKMHMAWVRYVGGRLKGDYRYSKDIVYNNFPWPENIAISKKKNIENCAQAVLDTRKKFVTSTLADLYDPLSMPSELLKAHQHLDKAVETAYRMRSFESESEMVAFLFSECQRLDKGMQESLLK